MNIKEKKLENARMEITIEVESGRMDGAYEKAFEKIQKTAKIDGFRPGKAPLALVKQKFADSAEQEAVEILVRDTYLEAVNEKDYHPISYPEFSFKEKFERGKSFTFTAQFDTPPTIELGGYRGIKTEERSCTVSDLDIMEEIESVRERMATIGEKDETQPVEKGDLAKIQYKRIDNIAADLIDATAFRDLTVIAGSRDDMCEFDPHVIGLKKGEEKDIVFTYPKDYQYTAFAGQSHTYRTVVMEVKKRILPELTDDFARVSGEFSSIDDMKVKIRERIEKFVGEKARGESKGEILRKIVEASKYEIPASIIENEKKNVFERLCQRIGYKANSIAEIAPVFGTTVEDLEAKLKSESEMSIKTTLAVTEIYKKEGLTVTEDQYETALSDMAKNAGRPIEEVKELIEKQEARSRLESEILYNQAVELVYEQAKVKKLSSVTLKEFFAADKEKGK